MNGTDAVGTFDFLCGKWTTPVVLELSSGVRRYTELERSLGGVSQKTLSRTLKQLESSDVVSRTVYPTAPRTVEYALTSTGKGGVGLLKNLRLWAEGCADQHSDAPSAGTPS